MRGGLSSITSIVKKMQHSILGNYIAPGLSSSIVGGNKFGVVRVFDSERSYQDVIAPHSHRYDFACLVLDGSVRNTIWTRVKDGEGDEFAETKLSYAGVPGSYVRQTLASVGWYSPATTEYRQGDIYHQSADMIHSIVFSRGAKVLFFEGPAVSDLSVVLDPMVDGKRIYKSKTEDWMFTPLNR